MGFKSRVSAAAIALSFAFSAYPAQEKEPPQDYHIAKDHDVIVNAELSHTVLSFDKAEEAYLKEMKGNKPDGWDDVSSPNYKYMHRIPSWGWGYWYYDEAHPYWPQIPERHKKYIPSIWWWGQDGSVSSAHSVEEALYTSGCYMCHKPIFHHRDVKKGIGIWFLIR